MEVLDEISEVISVEFFVVISHNVLPFSIGAFCTNALGITL